MSLFLLAILLLVISLVMIIGPAFVKSGDRSAKGFQLIGLISVFLSIALIIGSMVVVVDAGEVGVVLIFGKVQKNTLTNGIHLVVPYATIYKYPTRIMEYSQKGEDLIEARANNGLTIGVDATCLYAIDGKMAGDIYKRIAISLPQLQQKILLPTIRTVLRNVVSQYSPQEIYSSKREEVAALVEERLREKVSVNGILIESFLVRSIKVPEDVERAIEAKISAEQEAEAMEFKKQKAEREAEIKIIEAKGLAEAQQIINSTLSPNYIQLEAIRTYKELANSENTTFIIMPTSPNATGMPIILDSSKQ